ncbi:polyamine aminopropyltransferase [Hydrogenibacillus sp. N12]|nr:polyamine aminopropyltransferase [Hydrogenibacillus sp. N12]
MELWFTEHQTEGFGITARIRRALHSETTPYQRLDVLETEAFGTMLVLDGMVMTTERDEFVYHEMIVHPALVTHPAPRRVLVVGGGDGGAVREVLKHPAVEEVVLVEVDRAVVEASRRYLPSIAGALDDPRVRITIGDGFEHIARAEAAYDVILVDSTEPVGPAVRLFEAGFYAGIKKALRPEGLFVAQTDNPWFKPALVQKTFAAIAGTFPLARLYVANIPTYPSGLWTFTLGSLRHDPLAVPPERIPDLDTRYYTPAIHRAAFALPRFVERLLADGFAAAGGETALASGAPAGGEGGR